MSTPNTFNPQAFKTTTRTQWNSAAEAWHRWGPLLSRWLGPATQTMFDLCDLNEGKRVLDVAAGAGEQSVAAAKRVGSEGYVLATDLSPKILKFAKSSARLEGLNNLDVMEMDGEHLAELETELFDAVISRVGLIYFPDQQKALQGMRKQLKEGGKIGAVVYSTAEKNGFFSLPVSIIRKRANLPAPLPGQPGPFSLGNKEVLKKAFVDAGFKDVKVVAIDAPVRLSSAAECLQFEQESFGALHQMLSSASDVEKDDIWQEIEDQLRQFEQGGRFEGPCEVLVAVGTK
ncbi:MAG: class I SAM-dependent methyltransferase [Bdellovibrionales bacterium]|nr:class I SAM-dependent methyltransferase [Bdellovibrionales bacterium]